MPRTLLTPALVCFGLALLLSSCAMQQKPRTQPATVPVPELPSAWRPLSPAERPSTSAEIYLGNLDSRIAVLSARPDASSRSLLARLLLQRHRILGRLDDIEAALALLAQPEALDVAGLTTRAAIHMALHDFAAAEAALVRAEQIDGGDPALPILRRDLAVARGDQAFLQQEVAVAAQPVADVHELAHRADLLVNLGQLDLAMVWYRTAQDLHGDVDPWMLAWLQTQQGIALLRHERIAEARIYFETAYARLPQYYLAAEHLAECEMLLGNHDRARDLLAVVIAQTGNPEFHAMLAELEDRAGHADAAQSARARASAAYESLLARHPAAYAAHAAEFFLEIGQIDRARELALSNLTRRADWQAHLLAAQVALAAGENANACEQFQAAASQPLSPPEIDAFRAQLEPSSVVCDG